MNDVTKRLQIILKREGLNQQKFAGRLGISPSSLSQMLNGKQGISERFLKAFHDKFPEIRIEWLMFEKGEMLEEGVNGSFEALFDEESGLNGEMKKNEAKDIQSETIVTPRSLIAEPQSQPVEIVYRDRPVRQITEIRIFFDDGTFEIFAPKR